MNENNEGASADVVQLPGTKPADPVPQAEAKPEQTTVAAEPPNKPPPTMIDIAQRGQQECKAILSLIGLGKPGLKGIRQRATALQLLFMEMEKHALLVAQARLEQRKRMILAESAKDSEEKASGKDVKKPVS